MSKLPNFFNKQAHKANNNPTNKRRGIKGIFIYTNNYSLG